jgi:hypothetical protein
MKSNEELTIKEANAIINQAAELCSMLNKEPVGTSSNPAGTSHSFREGEAVFIRAVTNYYTGRVVRVTDSDVVLAEATWIADTKRFGKALSDGFSSEAEIEPYPDGCVVSRGAIVDWSTWQHTLPTKAQ